MGTGETVLRARGWTIPSLAAPESNSIWKTTICDTVVELSGDRYARCLRAIVLTGSLAREEASFSCERDACTVLGDAEFFLVFREGSKLPGRVAVEELRRDVEARLSRLGVIGHVDLRPTHPSCFRELPRHILSYELRTWGQVVWGDAQVLSLIPIFPPTGILLEDAWRMLNNRIVELLEVSPQLSEASETLPSEVFYRTVKLYLDMATSFLVFVGAYEASYQKRAVRLKVLVESECTCVDTPFRSFKAFSERVGWCTELKLRGASTGAGLTLWTEALADARLLWKWELERLTGSDSTLPGLELLDRWARCQPFRKKLRGWAYVLRRCGWHRSWRHWWRWVRCAWQGSPRYRIYAAGSELLFRIPELLDARQCSVRELDWERLQSFLPLSRRAAFVPERPAWQTLASDIAWNYHQFLEETTA